MPFLASLQYFRRGIRKSWSRTSPESNSVSYANTYVNSPSAFSIPALRRLQIQLHFHLHQFFSNQDQLHSGRRTSLEKQNTRHHTRQENINYPVFTSQWKLRFFYLLYQSFQIIDLDRGPGR